MERAVPGVLPWVLVRRCRLMNGFVRVSAGLSFFQNKRLGVFHGWFEGRQGRTRSACLVPWRQFLPFCLVLLVLPAVAQTNEELFREYQFDFRVPGARAGGMGSAFIGAADDAAASYANPAGLAFLAEPAITLEYGYSELDEQSGELQGAFNTQYQRNGRSFDNLRFFSFNANAGGWYFGLFRYEYLNERQNRKFASRSLSDGVDRVEERTVDLDLSGETQGIGVARRFGNFKLGVTLNRLSLEGKTSYERETVVISREPLFSRYQSDIDDDDWGLGYSIGLHHETDRDFSWGVVWRDNPSLSLAENVTEASTGRPDFFETFEVPFVVPDVLGAGVQYKIRPDLRVVLDWQRVFYSSILEDGFLIVESLADDNKENYAIDDVDEFHFGVEWLIPVRNGVWALRGGYFRDPLHTVRYVGEDEVIRARFSEVGQDDENHLTLGLGWVLHNRVEIDLALDLWESGSEVALSFIWRKK